MLHGIAETGRIAQRCRERPCCMTIQKWSHCTTSQRVAALHDDTESGHVARCRRERPRCTMSQRAATLHDVAESCCVAQCHRERPRCAMTLKCGHFPHHRATQPLSAPSCNTAALFGIVLQHGRFPRAVVLYNVVEGSLIA